MAARNIPATTRPTAIRVDTSQRAKRRKRVLLLGVDDVVGMGLLGVLSSCSELEVVGVRSVANDLPPSDVRVVDAQESLRLGENTASTLLASHPGAVVIAIAPDGRPDLMRRALNEGADGVMSLRWSAADIVATVLAAVRHDFVRPEALTCAWTGDGDDENREDAHGGDLTPRELQVLRLIAAGASNTEIAGRLYVSVNTVKTYIRSTYRRLDVSTRPQAMRWCFEHGLVQFPVETVQSELRERRSG